MPQGRENRLLRHAALGYDGPADPIFARTQYGRAWVGFVRENRTCAPADQVERARIGLHNIPAMRRNMGGRCGVRQDETRFRIALRFPRPPSHDIVQTIPPARDCVAERGPNEKGSKKT